LTDRTPVDILDEEGANRTPDEQIRWALSYILDTYDEAKIKRHRESQRDSLKTWIMENCEQDESGSYRWELPDPATVDGNEWITGFEVQRRVSEFIDEEKADALVVKYHLEDTCYHTVTEIDFDALYAANQRGIISDEEIDDMLSFTETYALMKIKQ
jgi:hypothetical protein